MSTFDDIKKILDDQDGMFEAAKQAVITARADLASTQAELTVARDALATEQAQVAALSEAVADRDAQIVALKAQIDAITQQPAPVQTTIWGASSITPGGSGTAAVQRVLDRWGAGVAVRLFVSDATDARLEFLPDIPEGVKLLHISWKPDRALLVSGALDANIVKLVAWARALYALGIIVLLEVWHEPDVKTRKGSGTRDGYAEAKAYFHQQVKQADPEALTISTLSAWTFTAAAKIDPEPWSLTADYLGVDFDGLNSTKAYPDYQTVADTVADFAAAHGYLGWCGPEIGEPRLASDPDGTQRAAWLAALAQKMEARGMFYGALYEFTDGATGYQLNDAEMAAFTTAIN